MKHGVPTGLRPAVSHVTVGNIPTLCTLLCEIKIFEVLTDRTVIVKSVFKREVTELTAFALNKYDQTLHLIHLRVNSF
jgi:hypothetical protein